MKTKKRTFIMAVIAVALCASSSLRADDKAGTASKEYPSSSSTQSGSQAAKPLQSDLQSPDSLQADSEAIEEAAGAESAKLDTEFLQDVMKDNQAELKIAQLAKDKAQSQSVKKYAEKLEKDHQAVSQKMEKIAQSKGLTKSSDLGQHQEHLDRLTGLSGAQFDQAFIQIAAKSHEKCIKKFEKQAGEGEDPAIRSFAAETLPALKQHLSMAKTLEGNANASLPELNEPAGAETPSAPGQDDQEEDDKSLEEDESSSASPEDAAQGSPSPLQPSTP